MADESGFRLIGSDRRNELEEENDIGKAVNKVLSAQIKEQLQIIEGMNNIFFSINVFNLVDGTYKLITVGENIKGSMPLEGIAADVAPDLIETLVAPEFRERMKTFVDLSTLNARLRDKRTISLDYLGNMGWTRAFFIPIERDEDGDVTKVAFALRLIQDIKLKELKQQAALEEQMTIITGLAAEYFSVILVDYNNDTSVIYRQTGKIGKLIGSFFGAYKSWSAAVGSFAANYVAREERTDFCKALSIEYIKNSPFDSSYNYQMITDLGVEHMQLRVTYCKDKSGRELAVIGTKSVNDEYEDHLRLQEAQRDLSRSYSLISGLSREYYTVWYITANDRRVHLFRGGNSSVSDFAGRLEFDDIKYESFISDYVDKYVDERERKRISAAVEFDKVMAKIADKDIYTVNYLRHLPDGEKNYHQMTFAKALERTGEINIVLAFRDVDNMVREEQEKQRVLRDALTAAEHANNAKTTFLNNMSHDIRTPMNAIIGFTSLAAAHINNTEQVRSYLEKIQISGKHLLSLINDALDMSRIESGKVKIDERPTSLSEVMHDIRTIVQTDITSRQLDFYIDTVDVVNENVICDKLRLNQVLMNILSNSMKFTRPGGVVSLRLIQLPCSRAGYALYEFHIKDTGIGMSKKILNHAFEPFEREETSTVSGIQGTGLGLAITKNIVDMMGGTIRVDSELNKGTEFTVALQFKTSGEAVKQEEIPQLHGLRALVADDDTDTCMSICKMLSSIGMRSEWTSQGKEAVIRTKFAIEQGDEFNAYIIDWLMPDMNGIEVVRRIRRIIGDSKPIIILTAYDWSDIEQEARDAGVTAFCSKPLFMSELRSILGKPFANDEHCKELRQDNSAFIGKRLLVVEDNELNREIAVEILKELGFEADIASDGDIAVSMVRDNDANKYALVLMDIQMPVMDGYEATRQIRGLSDKHKADIPIIAMTANAFDEDRENAIKAGMNGHISKPIEVSKLIDVLLSIIRNN